MVLIFEKRTQFNIADQINEFKAANYKAIKHKISRIREFNQKAKAHKKTQFLGTPEVKNVTNRILLRRTSTDHKKIMEQLKTPLKTVESENQYFTFVYDEVLDYLNQQTKFKSPSNTNKDRKSIKSSLLQDEEDFYAMNRLLSPISPNASSIHKEEIKLFKNMKIKTKRKTTKISRSNSPLLSVFS